MNLDPYSTALSEVYFPNQRIPNSQKTKQWCALCIDYVISTAVAHKDELTLQKKYNVLRGEIDNSDYKKIINPYNASNERYTKFPATLRNYDMIKGVVRRYVSEYVKSPHDFIVGSNNSEVILHRNAKLKQELFNLAQREIAANINKAYSEFVQNGGNPQEFNPQEHINIEEFVSEFNEKYVDDISKQGQELLSLIKDITNDELFYAEAYFNFVTFGECYTYSEIQGNKLVKRVVLPADAYPVPNNELFVEDYEMFAEKRLLSVEQILDEFGDYLTEKEIKYLTSLKDDKRNNNSSYVDYGEYSNYFIDSCGKFTENDRRLIKENFPLLRNRNNSLIEVWQVVWRSQTRVAIVSYIDEQGIVTTRIESDDYKLNKELGDVSIEYIYKPEIYQGVRIGNRIDGIYPFDARALPFNRENKLPYNGAQQILRGFGSFSIIDIMLPYQLFYNLVAFHREMIVAKNKLNILLIPKSVLGADREEALYRIISDGALYIDDENDDMMLRTQQIRMVSADMSSYINQLTALLADIEASAKMQVDMTPQRYGEIANYAGKANIEEAINRGSMGTVIIEFIMDNIRKSDYERDLDFTKLAWIDGLNTSFKNEDGSIRYISLNVDTHLYADYAIKVKNSIKEQSKLDQLKQFAFSAAQNGDNKMAIAAITGDNVASIKGLIEKYDKIKKDHEKQLQMMEQQNSELLQQYELQKIQAKGEQDRETLMLEGEIRQLVEYIRAESNAISYDSGLSIDDKENRLNRLDKEKLELERNKISNDQTSKLIDSFDKQQDRKVKLRDIEAKLEIAKTNRNKYDKKK